MTRLAGLAFLLSGLSGLLYEVVWVRVLGVVVGGEAIASQAVLTAYFAGMAAGAALIGPRLDRARSPLRAYALLEGGVALAAAWSLVALELARRTVPHLTSGVAGLRLGVVAFGAGLVAFLPATVLMGATLPALVRALGSGGDWRARAPRTLGRLYALNTLGAVAGSLLAGFVLMETVGSLATVLSAAALNVVAAILALVAARAASRADVEPAPAASAEPPATAPPVNPARQKKSAPASAPDRMGILLALGLSGFAAIAFEIAAVRVLAAALESTVYSFAATIAAYLLGIALASALHPILARRLLDRLAPATLAAMAALALALAAQLLRLSQPLLQVLLERFEDTWRGRIVAESLTALALVLPAAVPTTLVFLALAPAAWREQDRTAGDLAAAYTANTLGGALAPLVVALVLAPWAGSRGIALAAVLALLAAAGILGRRAWSGATLGAGASALLIATILPSPLFSWSVTPGHRLIANVEGAAAAVAVEDRGGSRVLRTGRTYFEGGSASIFAESRQGHLPMLIHPAPKRALVLGIGTGTTVGAVGQHPGVEVDGVELLAEVLDVLRHFDAANAAVRHNPRVNLHQADARSFVRAAIARGRYDVIVADLYHPQQSGVGNLYTREHFQAVRDALAPGGLFMQWLSLYELPPESLRSIVRTFLDVFPHASGWYAHFNATTGILGLCGSREALSPSPTWTSLLARTQDAALAPVLTPLMLDRPVELLGSFVTTRAALARLADGAPLNTDDRPFIEHATPRGHTADMRMRLRSLEEVRALRALPDEADLPGFFGSDPATAATRRTTMHAWQTAVDALIAGQRALALGDEDGAIEAWKAGLRAAPDFRVNYALLRARAIELAQGGRTLDGRNIALWLSETEPDNAEARQLLNAFVPQKPPETPAPEAPP